MLARLHESAVARTIAAPMDLPDRWRRPLSLHSRRQQRAWGGGAYAFGERSMQSRLRVTRRQILAFRRRVGALDERMPMGAESLRRAAWAGLQDSMPRAALLSLHARVDGVEPSTWEHPSLAQLWGPRYSTYVVARARLRAVLAREASRRRQEPASGRAHGRAAARPSRRRADDRPRGWARARRRQRDQVRRDDGHGRHPLGGRAGADGLDGRRRRDRPGRRVPRARSTLPPHLRAGDG